MGEDYQLPYWVSYVAFAVATVLLGGILGLFLVCCIDCVYPPRRDADYSPQQREDKKDSDVEEDDYDYEMDGSQASQSEGEETQEEDLSQEEDDGSQASQGEDEDEEDEQNFREQE